MSDTDASEEDDFSTEEEKPVASAPREKEPARSDPETKMKLELADMIETMRKDQQKNIAFLEGKHRFDSLDLSPSEALSMIPEVKTAEDFQKCADLLFQLDTKETEDDPCGFVRADILFAAEHLCERLVKFARTFLLASKCDPMLHILMLETGLEKQFCARLQELFWCHQFGMLTRLKLNQKISARFGSSQRAVPIQRSGLKPRGKIQWQMFRDDAKKLWSIDERKSAPEQMVFNYADLLFRVAWWASSGFVCMPPEQRLEAALLTSSASALCGGPLLLNPSIPPNERRVLQGDSKETILFQGPAELKKLLSKGEASPSACSSLTEAFKLLATCKERRAHINRDEGISTQKARPTLPREFWEFVETCTPFLHKKENYKKLRFAFPTITAKVLESKLEEDYSRFCILSEVLREKKGKKKRSTWRAFLSAVYTESVVRGVYVVASSRYNCITNDSSGLFPLSEYSVFATSEEKSKWNVYLLMSNLRLFAYKSEEPKSWLEPVPSISKYRQSSVIIELREEDREIYQALGRQSKREFNPSSLQGVKTEKLTETQRNWLKNIAKDVGPALAIQAEYKRLSLLPPTQIGNEALAFESLAIKSLGALLHRAAKHLRPQARLCFSPGNMDSISGYFAQEVTTSSYTTSTGHRIAEFGFPPEEKLVKSHDRKLDVKRFLDGAAPAGYPTKEAKLAMVKLTESKSRSAPVASASASASASAAALPMEQSEDEGEGEASEEHDFEADSEWDFSDNDDDSKRIDSASSASSIQPPPKHQYPARLKRRQSERKDSSLQKKGESSSSAASSSSPSRSSKRPKLP